MNGLPQALGPIFLGSCMLGNTGKSKGTDLKGPDLAW